MTLTFYQQGHGYILCPLVDFVGVHVKTIAVCQYLERYGDLNASMHLQYDLDLYP